MLRKIIHISLLGIGLIWAQSAVADQAVQLGPRPFFLVDQMPPSPLKEQLESCAQGPFVPSDFSIGHRGAPLQFPEHTLDSYKAAARMGAGILECDVAFTADRELVCRHSQCDLHTTTNILEIPDLAAKCSEPFSAADQDSGRKATAKCCTSDLTLAEFQRLSGKMDASDPWAATVEDYVNATPSWRTDLYSKPGQLMTLAESIALFEKLGVKHTPELKSPAVSMPFDGDYSQEDFARAMIDAYRSAGVDPAHVYPQSFDWEVVEFWLDHEPEFAGQVVYLDGRYSQSGFDPNDPESWSPRMDSLYKRGLRIIAPPLWVLLALDENNEIIPSAYARAAREAGLDIITWTLERSGSLEQGGGWYYQSVKDAISRDGDMFTVLDVLNQKISVRGVFSDWPATTTYYANCIGLN